MDKHIFRAYDVRGIVNKELTSDVVAGIGMAFGTYLQGKGSVMLGRDVRTTSRMMEEALFLDLYPPG